MVQSGLSTEDVLVLLQEVAAEVVTPRFRQLQRHEIGEKGPGSLVTVADHEAEVAITAALQRAYPDAVILGEEAYEADGSIMAAYQSAEHAFTVDPVDGTRNFVEGSPDHAVMVAETRRGETVRAWIWHPEHEVGWTAERGAGTWRNGERMHTQPVPKDVDPVGATSIWALRGKRLRHLPPMQRTWMSCGIDYPRLIEGAADFILYKRSWPWDHAPGTLLVSEAGGAAIHSDGRAYSPRSLRPGIIVAADPTTATRVRECAAEVFGR